MQQLHISYHTGYYKIFYAMPEIYVHMHARTHTHKQTNKIKTSDIFKITEMCMDKGYATWTILVFP
jgi:hypothetical protein